MSRVLGLTGASGYVGQAVMRAAAEAGWQVVAIGRHPVERAQAWRFADLDTPPADDLIVGLDALLHLAANTSGEKSSSSLELSFARGLATQARAAGIPMVFASSQAAAPDAPSDYGRTKYAIEQTIAPLGAVVIRPGLVIGGREAGLFGLLVALVRLSPLLPRLLPRPSVQPIHVDDLSAALLGACTRPDLSGRVLAAAGDAISFDEFLAKIARHRLRVRRLKLPVPVFLLRGALRMAERFLGARFSSDRLNSLIKLPPMDARADLASLNVVLRPLASALNRRGNAVRDLLLEGRALTLALVGAKPPPRLLRRYIYLLHIRGQNEALSLPTRLLSRPAWLAALDTPARRTRAALPGGLAWRMNVVMRLAESQPELADLFLMMPNRSGRLAALRCFLIAGIRELHILAVAPLAKRLAKDTP